MEEFREHADEPRDEEGQEPANGVPKMRNTRGMAPVQVGLRCVIHKCDHDRIDGAAKPREIRFEELQGLFTMFRGEPVALVRKIDQLNRHRANQSGQTKANQDAQDRHADKTGEECLLGLPTVGSPAAIKMGSDYAGQLRI